MLIWIKPGTETVGLISAQMPRYIHPCNHTWRNVVEQFMIHTCRRERCFKGPNGRILHKCKFGFPFDLCAEEHLDDQKIRYNYVREEEEDRHVASYVMDLLLFWDGHANVQRVTDQGWEMYLAKYIAKSEYPENVITTARKNAILPKKRKAEQPAQREELIPTDVLNGVNRQEEEDQITDKLVTSKQELEVRPYNEVLPGDSDVKRFLKMRVVSILESSVNNL